MENAPTDEMLMMLPPCSFIHEFQHDCVQTSGAVTLTSNVFCQRGRSASMTGPAYGFVAALLTSTSTAPNMERVASTTRSASSALPTLPAT